jgi:hypothetical protein
MFWCTVYLLLCMRVKLGTGEDIRTLVREMWRKVEKIDMDEWYSMHRTSKHMRSSLFWDITQHKLVVTNVLGQPVGPIFKGQAVQEHVLEVSRKTWREETA